jgi:serine/threonine protein kinase
MKHSRKLVLPTRKKPQFDSISEFILGRKLGDGAYAIVRKAIHINTEKTYAIKIIALSSLGENDYENVEKELDIHSSIIHDNIIGLVDFFMDEEKVYLVLEFAQKGNLFKFMNEYHTPDPELMGKMWCQTVKAIQYMHQNDIIMRDLKPENILVTKDFNIKICDFGWAARIDDVEYRRLKAGTYIYMSPESLEGKLQSYQSDVWSLGVLLFEMHHKREPFSCGISCNEQLYFIREQKVHFNSKLDLRVQDLISGCLIEDKSKRFHLKDLIETDYFKEFLFKAIDPEKQKKRGLGFLPGRKMIPKNNFLNKMPKQKIFSKKDYHHQSDINNKHLSFTDKPPVQAYNNVRKSPGKFGNTKKKTIRLNDFISKKYSKSNSMNLLHSSSLIGLNYPRTHMFQGSVTFDPKSNPKYSHSTLPKQFKISDNSSPRMPSKTTVVKPSYTLNTENYKKNETLGEEKKKTLNIDNTNKNQIQTLIKNKNNSTKENLSSTKTEFPKSYIANKNSNVESSNSNPLKFNPKEQSKPKGSGNVYKTHKSRLHVNDLKVNVLKRSNTQVGKPMFGPGFIKRERNVDLFKHKKNNSMNDKILKLIDFGHHKKTTSNLQNTNLESGGKSKMEKSVLQNSKMESVPDSHISQKPVFKTSSSRKLIKLKSYKTKKVNDLNVKSDNEQINQSKINKEKNSKTPTIESLVLNQNKFTDVKPNSKIQNEKRENLKSKYENQDKGDNSDNPNTMRTRDTSATLSRYTVDPEEKIKFMKAKTFVYQKPKDKTESFEHVLRKKKSVRKIKLNEYFKNK